jgi:Ca2+-binding EF-hand superfamily protein
MTGRIKGTGYSDSLSRIRLMIRKVSTDKTTDLADSSSSRSVKQDSAFSLDHIFSKMDTNRDGVISKDEFTRISSDAQENVKDSAAALQSTSTESLIELLQSIGSAGTQYETKATQSSDSSVARIGSIQADQIFSKIDIDGDGKISKDELAEARACILENMKNSVKGFQLKLTESLLNMMEKLGSMNTDAGVTNSPGTTVAQTSSAQPDRDRVFGKFDTNGDGKISKDELQKGMSEMHVKH